MLPIPRVVTRDLSTQLSPIHAYEFLSRCRFSTPTPRQPMVELFVLASSRFPLRKPEEKLTPAESRTHKFRLSGRTLYPLVHGGSHNHLTRHGHRKPVRKVAVHPLARFTRIFRFPNYIWKHSKVWESLEKNV